MWNFASSHPYLFGLLLVIGLYIVFRVVSIIMDGLAKTGKAVNPLGFLQR